jgi:hypothetical protein
MIYLYSLLKNYINSSEMGPELFANHGTARIGCIYVHIDLFAIAYGRDLEHVVKRAHRGRAERASHLFFDRITKRISKILKKASYFFSKGSYKKWNKSIATIVLDCLLDRRASHREILVGV